MSALAVVVLSGMAAAGLGPAVAGAIATVSEIKLKPGAALRDASGDRKERDECSSSATRASEPEPSSAQQVPGLQQADGRESRSGPEGRIAARTTVITPRSSMTWRAG
jgi:hypothetical protein